jgi:prenyltransferase/squalene oxidase-like repeat protein
MIIHPKGTVKSAPTEQDECQGFTSALCHNGRMAIPRGILDWLFKGDPAIRWQVMRDLLDEPAEVYEAERANLTTDGWGARLLAEQDPDGNWGGGVYSPKWISTTYTLLTLRHFGLMPGHPQALRGCDKFYERGLAADGGINLFKTRASSETCVNGMLLTLLSYFRHPDERVHGVAEYLLGEQMSDGGWNCRWSGQRHTGDGHASFNTTLLALQGFAEYVAAFPHLAVNIEAAIQRGQEFLLAHRLYKSHRTGRIVDSKMTHAHFPPRWHYDFLAALDYFQSVGAPRDQRVQDAVDLLLERRSGDGPWTLADPWPAKVFFELEAAGRPSRWNTLRALRVLKWWDR